MKRRNGISSKQKIALRVYYCSNLYLDYKALNQWFVEKYNRLITAFSVAGVLLCTIKRPRL
ncbi:hypothetical protein K432DRAFT_310435 [Lepidopterella palustris CBS 459.81]|uniref:ARS-binding protein 1 N-terminal domain-containing protein n=1 Tax=Lepidopterella palustris CBS 459.81 TaxID=1314670 RepID=A0A8E2DZJ6_9PEZI|nr:hypothetical protein K432DRAFT_310435 [Lepidopterella palustris CBS 459.81]